MKRVNDYVNQIHKTAVEKGWYENPRSALEIHALIHSEISEATEEVRNNKEDIYYNGDKPEGEAVELIDAVIRIMDYFGHKNWDFEKTLNEKIHYNFSREHRHGGKKY